MGSSAPTASPSTPHAAATALVTYTDAAAARITSRGADRAREGLERKRCLMHEHPEPVRGRHSSRTRLGQQRGLRRVVHGVHDEPALGEGVGGERGALTTHAERRGVHHDVAARDRVAHVLHADRGRARREGCRGFGGGEPPGGNRDRRSAPAQRLDDRTRRATGTEHDDPLAGGVDALVEQRAHQPFPVGRVTEERRPTRDDQVDRLQGGCGLGELVARGCGIALVRHRDAETGDLERTHTVERAGGPARSDVERDEHPVEAQRPERGVVDRRRSGVRDGITDDAGDARGATGRHSRPLSRAAATFRLCSSSVVANACFPFSSAMT